LSDAVIRKDDGIVFFSADRTRCDEVDARKKRELNSAPVDATSIGNGIREPVRE
jgi:hypothetical protein